ncbi:hypothetical protein M569_14002 [Genlisea aurea]|uniref:Protein FRA10AC1 n=1 Tax=Genlisea aurea TaxID=192259 RepID=S8C268_9LAMI|nr:hypothetical protein M569_14002 [Genlisea aurea]
MASFRSLRQEIFDKEARKRHYQEEIRGLNAYDRHSKYLNDYARYYGNRENDRQILPVKSDQDTLREGYRFIRTEEDDLNPSWEKKLVKRYYDKLFKEYCLADMSQYKAGKIGLRWRTEKEVISGKGQFVCGNKRCDCKDSLSSYEASLITYLALWLYGISIFFMPVYLSVTEEQVNFSYHEAGENKQALVKLVTCER